MSRARDLANSADKDITGTLTVDDITLSGNITVGGTVDGRDIATDGTKLDGVEANATADQTGAEIKTAYEGEADTNAYTDAEKTKLSGVEAGADVTDATNVQAAGALMDSEVTNLAQVKAFNSSDYATAAQGTTADAALPKAGGTMTGAITFTAGQTFDGRDVSADGSKLDGIESGATGDQTASEILTAIKTVDGSGSGLDADTLDGQQGSYYYAASNPSGYTTFTANQSLNTTSSPTFSNPNLTSALRMGGTQVLSSGRALTNIASIDATTATAIGNAGVGGGGTIDLTADGSISAGDPVGITNAGKVKTVTAVESAATTVSGSQYGVFALERVSSDKFIIGYKNNSGYLRLRVGQIASNNSITWGSEHNPSGSTIINAGYADIAVDEANGKFILYFRYEDSSYYAYAIGGSISGTTITTGNLTFIDSTNGQYYHQIEFVGNNKYLTHTQANTFWRHLTLSGTSVSSSGSSSTTTYGNSPSKHNLTNIGTNKFLYNGGSYYREWALIDTSGTNPSVQSTNHGAGPGWDRHGGFYDSGTGYYVRIMSDSGNGAIQVWDVSNSNPSNWSMLQESTLSDPPYYNLNGEYVSSTSSGFVTYRQASSQYIQKINTSSSGDLILGTIVTTSAPNGMVKAADIGGKLLTTYYDSDVGNYVVRSYTMNSTYFSVIGISESTVSNGQTATITIASGVNSSLSGLTVGQPHGVALSGDVSAGAAPTLGVATSATSLLLT